MRAEALRDFKNINKRETSSKRRHLQAVRSGRIVVFPAPVFSVPGPDALAAGEKLRAEVEKL